ncbi:MAG: SoxR reducing system RseC family protein [Actinomycetota bacterium]|nr:SoxR reducing system RseC family protein [Actinomycetota bacterium]
MICSGKVIEAKGEIATVSIESTACDECKACGLAGLRDKKDLEVKALNRIGASTGDTVSLEISGKRVISASAILFMIPLLSFLIGLAGGYLGIAPAFGLSKTATGLILGFALLAGSYFLVHVLGEKSEFEFVVSEIIPKENE